MRKSFVTAGVVFIVAVAGSYVAYGQTGRDGMMGRNASEQNMRGSDGTTMPLRGMMAQSMAHAMSQQSLVATSDGGVIVLAGGKLMKYDGGLGLVKEVQLNVDYDRMQERMQRMMENMPMMRGGMMRSSGGGAAQP
jgi:hypothetical protein